MRRKHEHKIPPRAPKQRWVKDDGIAKVLNSVEVDEKGEIKVDLDKLFSNVAKGKGGGRKRKVEEIQEEEREEKRIKREEISVKEEEEW